jgi:hypothetical protein
MSDKRKPLFIASFTDIIPLQEGLEVELKDIDNNWCRELGKNMVIKGTQANLDDWELFLERHPNDKESMKSLQLGFEDAWYSEQSKRENG